MVELLEIEKELKNGATAAINVLTENELKSFIINNLTLLARNVNALTVDENNKNLISLYTYLSSMNVIFKRLMVTEYDKDIFPRLIAYRCALAHSELGIQYGEIMPPDKIIFIMEKLNLTNKALAELLDLNFYTIGTWKRGRYCPSRVESSLLYLIYVYGIETFKAVLTNENVIVGSHILQQRKKEKISQAQYEVITGISRATISRYENKDKDIVLTGPLLIMVKCLFKYGKGFIKPFVMKIND